MKRLAFAALAFSSLISTATAAPLAGYDRLDIRSPHRAYPIAASVWYPLGTKTYIAPIGGNILFKGTPAYIGAGVKAGKFPLFLLSHGSGGAMDTISWLSSALAKRGAMVLAVNHQGSTSGDSSPRRSVRLDERAKDLSAALDGLLADPAFARHIDRQRITSIGFSLGGATALNLAGLQFNAKGYAAYCDKPDEKLNDCAFFAKGDVDFHNLPSGFSAKMKDDRISAAIAIDPAFTYVATDKSIAALTMPVSLINLGTKNRLYAGDVGPKGSKLAARLPNARYSVIAPAHHFTFLAECKPGADKVLEDEKDDPICTDPAKTDRKAVHAQIIKQIVAFSGLK